MVLLLARRALQPLSRPLRGPAPPTRCLRAPPASRSCLQSQLSSQVVVEKKLMREKELTRHDLGCDKCISEAKAAAATKVAEGAAPRGKGVNHKSPAKAQKAKTSSLPAKFFDSQGVKRQNDGTGFEGRSVRHEVAGVQPPIKEAVLCRYQVWCQFA